MIDRTAIHQVKSRLAMFPVVALVGPRQAGKTTLARSLAGVYFDLEQEQDQLKLDLEWDKLVTGRKLLILDEAQEWPSLFKRLRGAVDRRRKRNGRFLLLGSVSPSLMRHVSESLAGRMAMVELTPFLWQELTGVRRRRLWLHGGYPDGGVLKPSQYPLWQQSYLEILTSRDLPNWGLPAKPQLTMRLLRMLAAVHGQTLNASQLGQSLDISYKTVKSYLDYLEGAFLIRQLQPFYKNLKKRIVKSPKIYWRDGGLLHALLNVSSEEQLLNQAWVGADWEGFVIEQILGTLQLSQTSFSPFFLRTNDRYEIDLLLELGRELWAIEIKLTSSPARSDFQRLNKIADLVGAKRRILISRTRQTVDNAATTSCNLDSFLQQLV